jgi:mannose-6-phosphate isomerase-like protein (cupin superfamily)
MRRKLGLLILLPVLAFGATASPKHNIVDHWTRADLDAMEKPLHEQISGPRKNITTTLAEYGDSGTAIAHREANGPGESHAGNDDYFLVRSGEATLVTGGSIVNARQTAPGEIRGDSIEGGERRKLTAGDIVHVSAGVPHQLLVESGKGFTYFIVRAHNSSTP